MAHRRAPDKSDLQEFADKVAKLLYWCATHENSAIAFYRDMPYDGTKQLLMQAIRAGWPDVATTDADVQAILDIYADCGENIAFCVKVHEVRKLEEACEI